MIKRRQKITTGNKNRVVCIRIIYLETFRQPQSPLFVFAIKEPVWVIQGKRRGTPSLGLMNGNTTVENAKHALIPHTMINANITNCDEHYDKRSPTRTRVNRWNLHLL